MNELYRNEISDIFERVNIIRKSYIIFGHKKSGKTHFLMSLYNELKKNLKIVGYKTYIPIFIDGNRITDDILFQTIIEDLTNKINKIPMIPKNIKNEYKSEFEYLKKFNKNNIHEFIETISIIRKMLSKYIDLKLVIIYDNIETTILVRNDIQPISTLRFLASGPKLSEHLFVIVSGGVKLYDYHSKGGSPLTNISESIILSSYGACHIKDALNLIDLENKEKFIKDLEEIFGNHPLIIHYLLEKLNSGNKKLDGFLFDLKNIHEDIESLFRQLNNNDLEVFEAFCMKDVLSKPQLIKDFGVGLKDIERTLMHLRVSNLIIQIDATQIKFRLNGLFFAKWFFENAIGKIPHLLSTGHSEMDIHLMDIISSLKQYDMTYPLLLDFIELLRYFGNRYILHTKRPSFLLTPALKYLEGAKTKKKEGKIKNIRLEVDFLQNHLIEDMEKDTQLSSFFDKEVEIHGGKEDIIFKKRSVRIPIELKSIWQDTEIREIKKIIQDDYIAEIAHHARNTGLGILVILDIRNSVKALNLKDNNFIMFDKESKCPIFVCVFQKYGKPSSA